MFTLSFAFSQDADIENMEKIIEVKALRNQLFQEKLKLNAADTALFFQGYDAQLMESRKLKKSFRKKWSGKKVESLTDKEAKEYYQDALQLQNQEMQLLDQYLQNVARQWGWSRAVRIKTIEKEVQPVLLKKANELKIQKKSKVKSK
jgi:hypothetical protein